LAEPGDEARTRRLALLDLMARPGFGYAVVGLGAALLLAATQIPQQTLDRDAPGWSWGDLTQISSLGLARLLDGTLALLVCVAALLHLLARLLRPEAGVRILGPAASALTPEAQVRATARVAEWAKVRGLPVRVSTQATPRGSVTILEHGHARQEAWLLGLAGAAALAAIAVVTAHASPTVIDVPVGGGTEVTRPILRAHPESLTASEELRGGCRQDGDALDCKVTLGGRESRWRLAPGQAATDAGAGVTWVARSPAPISGRFDLLWAPPAEPAERTRVQADIGSAFSVGQGAMLWTFASGAGPFAIRTGPHPAWAGAPALAPRTEGTSVDPSGTRATVPFWARVEIAAPLPGTLCLLAALFLAVALVLRAFVTPLRVELRTEADRLVATIAPGTAPGRLLDATALARKACGLEQDRARPT